MENMICLLALVYREGVQAYKDKVYCFECPYEGVSEQYKEAWEKGWWDAWYED